MKRGVNLRLFFKELYSNIELLKYLFLIIVVCFIAIPILFNYLIMWDSGLARGDTGDWFTFYGNIVGGLIGGAFTYLALIKTFEKEEQKESTQKQDELKIKIKECILNNKTYLNSLSNTFLLIQSTVVFEDLTNALENFINKGNYDFDGEEEMKRYHINEKYYRQCLEDLLTITNQYEEQLKNDLIALSGDKFYNFQHSLLTFNNSLKNGLKVQERAQISFEFLSNFVIWKENFGYRSVLNKFEDENDNYYQDFINEDMICDYLREVDLPHIKG